MSIALPSFVCTWWALPCRRTKPLCINCSSFATSVSIALMRASTLPAGPTAISDQPFFQVQGSKGEIVVDGFGAPPLGCGLSSHLRTPHSQTSMPAPLPAANAASCSGACLVSPMFMK